MRKRLALILGMGCLLGPSFAHADDRLATVLRIIDGDSIRVAYQNDPARRATYIRLIDIDCPELSQAFGRDAKAITSTLLAGQTVMVTTAGKDRYGRTLATVRLIDGRSANEELVRVGACWRYRKSKNAAILTLQQAAQQAHRGLWTEDDPMPPWKYRKREPVRTRE